MTLGSSPSSGAWDLSGSFLCSRAFAEMVGIIPVNPENIAPEVSRHSMSGVFIITPVTLGQPNNAIVVWSRFLLGCAVCYLQVAMALGVCVNTSTKNGDQGETCTPRTSRALAMASHMNGGFTSPTTSACWR